MSGFQERIIISVLASLLALGSLFAAAQEAPGGAKPAGAEREATLHSVSEEVYLDIVARDRRGKTVRAMPARWRRRWPTTRRACASGCARPSWHALRRR